MSTENKTLAEQVAALETELAVLKAKMTVPGPCGRWKPEGGESYFSTFENGSVREYRWKGSHAAWYRYATGNLYKTKEEAEKALRRRKREVEWADLAAATGFVPDWNSLCQTKWCGGWDHWTNSVHITDWCDLQIPGGVYFPSRKSLEEALEKFGKDKFKEMMGVE